MRIILLCFLGFFLALLPRDSSADGCHYVADGQGGWVWTCNTDPGCHNVPDGQGGWVWTCN